MDFKNLNKRKLEEDVEIDVERLKKSESYKEKGNELYQKLEYDQALDYYFKSITLNPTDHRCYGNIGQILIKKGLYSEAKECLQAAIDLNSNYAKAYYRLGLIEKQLKNYNEALINFDKVLKLEPNNKATLKEYDELKGKLGISKKNDGQVVKDKISLNSIVSNGSKDKLSPTSKDSSSKKLQNSTGEPIKNVNNIKFPKLNIPFQLPNTQPKNSYQFNLFWKEIKDDQTKLDYLEFVGANHFLKLFQKNLEPDFLSELFMLFTKMDKHLAFNLIVSITKIDTFDFVIMFMSKKEKELLKQTINSLIDQTDSHNLDRLIKMFKI